MAEGDEMVNGGDGGGGGGGETIGRLPIRRRSEVEYDPEKKPLPKFGDWNDNSFDVSDSHTHIFNKTRGERGPDIGRDTNRLDYFSVTAFNVHGEEYVYPTRSIADYGGGHKTREVVAGPKLKQDRGIAGGGRKVHGVADRGRAGDGDRSRQIPANNDNGNGKDNSNGNGGSDKGRGLGWWCPCWH